MKLPSNRPFRNLLQFYMKHDMMLAGCMTGGLGETINITRCSWISIVSFYLFSFQDGGRRQRKFFVYVLPLQFGQSAFKLFSYHMM